MKPMYLLYKVTGICTWSYAQGLCKNLKYLKAVTDVVWLQNGPVEDFSFFLLLNKKYSILHAGWMSVKHYR